MLLKPWYGSCWKERWCGYFPYMALMSRQRPWHLVSGRCAATAGEPPSIYCGAGASSTAWEHRYDISEGAYR
jgi:hypothetical protein